MHEIVVLDLLLMPYTRRWDLSRPDGMWAAERRSDDGRKRWYTRAATRTELARQLTEADRSPWWNAT